MKPIFMLAWIIIQFSLQVYCQSPTTGLVAYWPFNGNAKDESGNGNHGTITGELITPVADRFGVEGKAYKFWFPSYISVPTNSSFFTNEFTISYWNKVEAYWGLRSVLSCVGNNGGYQQVLDGSGFTYLLGYNFSNPGDKWFWASYVVPNTPNTWQHIIVTYQKTGENSSTSKLYLNGELKSSDTYANSIAYPGSEIFYIGRNHSDLGLNGELDDIRFYNRLLNETEIKSLFNENLTSDLEEKKLSNIKIYPNPIYGDINVDMGLVFKTVHIKIFDIAGRLIKEKEYHDEPRFLVNLDEPAGMYFLTIIYENKKTTYKIIKE